MKTQKKRYFILNVWEHPINKFNKFNKKNNKLVSSVLITSKDLKDKHFIKKFEKIIELKKLINNNKIIELLKNIKKYKEIEKFLKIDLGKFLIEKLLD